MLRSNLQGDLEGVVVEDEQKQGVARGGLLCDVDDEEAEEHSKDAKEGEVAKRGPIHDGIHDGSHDEVVQCCVVDEA